MSTTSPSRGRSQTPATQSPRSPQGDLDGVPRNVCHYYWKSGGCIKSFDCPFRHVRQPDGRSEAVGVGDPTDAEYEEVPSLFDFFSPDAYAAGAGSGREAHHMNPSEVHNHLKEFLPDNYYFSSAKKIQGFVRILASVNVSNKSWDTKSAQDFLDTVVKGNALHRIGDVLRFEPIHVAVGLHAEALSFQKGYFPLFQFFSSDCVLKSTMHKNINVLYSIIKNNHESVIAILQRCLGAMMERKTWKDPTPNVSLALQNSLNGVMVFRSISTVLLQYFDKFKDVVLACADIPSFVLDFFNWFETWVSDVTTSPPRFDDSITSWPESSRGLMISLIREDLERLTTIVERETGVVLRLREGTAKSTMTAQHRTQARITQLAQTYNPPGKLRRGGPRHDNDFDQIRMIQIGPTHEELFCPVAPYIPIFSPDAPHHLPAGSMERHLDIQFRLLREEHISTTRSSITAIHDDLMKIWEPERRPENELKTKLETLIEKKGGAYRTSGRDSVFFQIYTNVEFLPGPPEVRRRGVIVTLTLDAPAVGHARDKDAKKRHGFWEHSKQLQGSALVVLIVVADKDVRAYLGVVASFGNDIAESSKLEQGRIRLRVSFFDSAVELMALRGDPLCTSKGTFAMLVDNGVMFDAVRPFLHKLQTTEPTQIPFGRYITSEESLKDTAIPPPMYARASFKFRLQCLAKSGSNISDLEVTNPHSVARARNELKQFSVLDPSQADAVVDTLTKEVSLIQGPPGTGKSFTAMAILRVLFATAKVRPIMLIALTNHALDHMVTSVLDARITEKIIRLGTRSSSERISQYTLYNHERIISAQTNDRKIKRQYKIMKDLEEAMTSTMTAIRLPSLTWHKIEEYLNIHYPDHVEIFRTPPFWISQLAELMHAEEEKEGEFEVVGKKGKEQSMEDSVSRTLYGFWREGFDLQYISQVPLVSSKKGKERARQEPEARSASLSFLTDPPAYFEHLGFGGTMPPLPTQNRSLGELLETENVWSMSAPERRRLSENWERKIRRLNYESQLDQYHRIKEQHQEACQDFKDMQDEIRRRILSQTDLIACTTTGAATLTSLLSSITPKVLMVEEAGQVLEAHVLSSLVPSVRHLICIGDPRQLRPTLATYTLSMESQIGNELYKFDRSLMERLSDNGFPMSQLNVQRRMRPTISHFIRILYPKLEDNQLVHDYPPVQGMQKDVFFFNHLNKESGAEDSVSKYNTFEVEMIKDLVQYFLRQDSYNGPGDIAVLCAYLGQLQKVRAALRDLKIAVAVDERDAEALERQGMDEDVEFEEVLVSKHVRLGTVDIFQGQEAKIVIVSLVRNSGQIDSGSGSIGFLKSANRINVALSRAKHGLYVFGNAANLRQNATWSTIISEMESRDQIGSAFPIICPRHPDQAQLISKPRQLDIHSPAGGCTLPCDARLLCGHICPSVCHTTLDNHNTTRCSQKCNRTPCSRKHPCHKLCSDECGKCEFPVYKITLPCGHIAAKVPCHILEDLSQFRCHQEVTRQLPGCEHKATMPCHKDPSTFHCNQPCTGTLRCCTKTCKARCSACRSLTIQHSTTKTVGGESRITRTHHVPHPCERRRYCEHKCGLDCHLKDESCNPSCREACRQRCIHTKCKKPCHEPCAPCMEPCPWSCAHQSCPVLCGSICARLPCDELCSNTLPCGHPCPSVCGEPCAQQKCVECIPPERKADIVDFIMQRRLDEIDLTSDDVSERLITLACGHIFTVETLDGHCNMAEFYNVDDLGQYLSTKAPPINYQTPPTCPTCRGPITALRYGRVTKRATLDILEQNVAGTMSRSLEECSPAISEFTSTISDSQEKARKLEASIPDGNTAPVESKDPDSYAETNGPLPANAFDQQGMHKIHGLLVVEASAWYRLIKPIVTVYRRLWRIATTRGAHIKAYEASFATLFRLEMQEIANDPTRAADAPQPLALEFVNQKIGQPRPKADVRFQVDAYFLSLEVRALVAQLAQSRIEGLPLTATSASPDAVQHRAQWTSFVSFMYTSCIADAKKATKLALESSALRQAARASVQRFRFEFELFRWKITCERAELTRRGTFDEKMRDKLGKSVKDHKQSMSKSVVDVQDAYLKQLPELLTPAERQEERRWFDENCRKKIEAWQGQCDVLEDFIVKGGFYQPLSTQELEDIVKSFNFEYRGHFYNCQNGHTFVITECGGAMEATRCPECKAPIGGSRHHLESTNTRNRELEEIAERQGVGEGHYWWNRN